MEIVELVEILLTFKVKMSFEKFTFSFMSYLHLFQNKFNIYKPILMKIDFLER